jgi:outer membrane protein assembly factor BamD (BamD/ComL family)
MMQRDDPQPGRSDFLDFELEIDEGRGREYPVRVLGSPAGEARETMHFPFDELALDLRLGKLQIALLRSGGKHRRVPSPEEQAVQDFGQALFDALLAGEIRNRYDMSLREAEQQDKGLRLKLRIRPPKLSALPWEFLYDRRQGEYVCLSRRTPIVRYLESSRLIKPLKVALPLRVLGMIASPQDQPALDIECEKERVQQAIQDLRARSLVELEWLPGQTWRDLQEAMWGGPWHIFHFIGHGGFDANSDEGFIALVDRVGRTNCLSATRLGRLLADHTPLRLVLLNSCEGAKGSDRDIFSSTASILVRRGIPAVVAMQYEITDNAAVELARAFYRALAYGMAVDEAVVAARKAISLAVANTVEWGTPVLYMRSPDGVLFQMAYKKHVGRPPAEDSKPPVEVEEELAQQLEKLYTDALSAYHLGEWGEAVRQFQAIVELQPDYEDAADMLVKARRQVRWDDLYEQAQAARETENWQSALPILEELVGEKADYKDAAALLELMKRRKRQADLYAHGQRLYQAKQWQAVINVFDRITALEPNYPDTEGLLAAAQQEVAAQERQAELDNLYNRALEEIDAERWAVARQLLTQIQEQRSGFRETESLLAQVEIKIKIHILYLEAKDLAAERQWPQALTRMHEIGALDPDFADPERIAAKAQEEIHRGATSGRSVTQTERQQETARPRTLTFPDGDAADKRDELLALSVKHWDYAAGILDDGTMADWLRRILHDRVAVQAAEAAVEQWSSSPGAALESFIRQLDPAILPPGVMELRTTSLSLLLSDASPNHRIPRQIEIANRGQGYLRGEYHSSQPWVLVSNGSFACPPGRVCRVPFEIDTTGLAQGSHLAAITLVPVSGKPEVFAVQIRIRDAQGTPMRVSPKSPAIEVSPKEERRKSEPSRGRIPCLYCRGQGVTRGGLTCPICHGTGYW